MPPWLVASLSVVPGAGHLAAGKRGEAAALFAVDLGIVCSIVFVRSGRAYVLAGFVYLMLMVPAVIETYALARGTQSRFAESKPYIVVLLLATGFPALPLLWQSSVFSKRSKIGWSIAVPVLAVLFFSFLGVYGMWLVNFVTRQLG